MTWSISSNYNHSKRRQTWQTFRFHENWHFFFFRNILRFYRWSDSNYQPQLVEQHNCDILKIGFAWTQRSRISLNFDYYVISFIWITLFELLRLITWNCNVVRSTAASSIHPRQKKVVLFPEIGRVKIFLSLTRSHSRIWIIIYIFKFKEQQTNNNKKPKRIKKAKEINEEKRTSPENRWKNLNLRPPGKMFLVTRISGNKSIIFFGLSCWGVLVVNFEHILHILLVFPLLDLNK